MLADSLALIIAEPTADSCALTEAEERALVEDDADALALIEAEARALFNTLSDLLTLVFAEATAEATADSLARVDADITKLSATLALV
ncbi:MAG TPA: hypothetical protein K8U88_01365 [Levilactobacillus hammesii]|uniref:Uncharacterized protein n=1 Tax=Levilactobacillus hammesii TaxID=267633 RepID=A0A921EYP0_9LACO|nr:hypothetical protein [Levilactobacillus hammesii]